MSPFLNWEQLTLFCYITLRMSGFVMFSPIFGRPGIPGIFKAGFVLMLSLCVAAASPQGVPVPGTLVEFVFRLLMELFLGFTLSFIMNLFFYIPQLAGEVIDTQMGFTMGKTYDAGLQTSLSVTSQMINVMMFLIFFAANGHHTLLRILVTSGDVVTYGAVSIGPNIANAMLTIFLACTLLAVKLALPILAAELLGQVGMGLLMKTIPQINVFAINIELKVIIGLVMVMLMISPFSEFLLVAENQMLGNMQTVLKLAS